MRMHIYAISLRDNGAYNRLHSGFLLQHDYKRAGMDWCVKLLKLVQGSYYNMKANAVWAFILIYCLSVLFVVLLSDSEAGGETPLRGGV
jgi:hypothetical protein